MSTGFVNASASDFTVGGQKITLRGFGLGNWLNTEHFMIGLPGTESQLAKSLIEAYGPENAAAFWHKYRGCYVTEADLKFLKSLNVNSVRIPFNYRLFESDELPYQYDPQGFAEIDRVLALCEKYQIYAILDLHTAPGGQNPDWHSDNPIGESLFWEYPELRRRVISLWRYIAAHYRDNPWVAAYDLLNEAVLPKAEGSRVAEFYQELCRAIRMVDPNHLFLIEGNFYAQDFTKLELDADPNLAYSFHFYPSFLIKGERTRVTPEELKKKFLRMISLDYIRERLDRPVWCGETGMLYSEREHQYLLGNTLDLFEELNISWSIWAYKDTGGIGALHPGANSPWSGFSRRACDGWNFYAEIARTEAEVKELLRQAGLATEGDLFQKLKFRTLANRMLLSSARYPGLLAGIPFNELLTYPESFLFERCERWDGLIDIVKSYTKA